MESLANPLKNIRKPSGSRARSRRLEAGEFERILASLADGGNRYAASAFVLAIETSLQLNGRFPNAAGNGVFRPNITSTVSIFTEGWRHWRISPDTMYQVTAHGIAHHGSRAIFPKVSVLSLA